MLTNTKYEHEKKGSLLREKFTNNIHEDTKN